MREDRFNDYDLNAILEDNESIDDTDDYDLDEILDDSEEVALADKLKNFNLTSKRVLAPAGVLVLLILLSGFIWNPFGDTPWFLPSAEDLNLSSPLDNPLFQPPSDEDEVIVFGEDEEEIIDLTGIAPVNLFDWQSVPADSNVFTYEQLEFAIMREVRQGRWTNIWSAFNILHSEEAGFTMDIDERYLEDGQLNPNWTIVTREHLTTFLADAIHRLINPVYGGWYELQHGENFPNNSSRQPVIENAFGNAEIFTDEFLDSIMENTRMTPILADWQGDNFGLDVLLDAPNPRWFGEIVRISANREFDVDGPGYFEFDEGVAPLFWPMRVVVEVEVEFAAWTEYGTRRWMYGTLNLVIDNVHEVGFRISNAILVMED